jgi:hypothetical protein
MNACYTSVIVPGQDKLGGASFKRNFIVNTRQCLETTPPCIDIDLGQGNCIRHFQDNLLQHNESLQNKKYILCGTSQGAATLVNWAAQMPQEKQKEKIGCMVLESPLGSGNSTIMYQAEQIAGPITMLPFSRFWGPVIAKAFFFPKYNPLGKQAISSAAKISPEVPVIIMHAPNDRQISINDSRKLYCNLRENGNQNAYLMEIDTNLPAHLDVLDYDREKGKKIAALQAIYKKHKLPYNSQIDTRNINIKAFQPTLQEVRQKIESRERIPRYLRNTIDILSAGLALGYLYSKFAKK